MTSSQSSSEFDGHSSTVTCYCGLKAPRWTSWSDANPGRRFHSCPKYKNPEKCCTFFAWYDGEMSRRAKEVIIEQRDTLKALRSDNFELKRCNFELQKNQTMETYNCDDVCAIRFEIKVLNCKLNLAIEEANKEKKKKNLYRIGFIITCAMLLVGVFGF